MYHPCPNRCAWSPGNPIYLEPAITPGSQQLYLECEECRTSWTPEGLAGELSKEIRQSYAEDTGADRDGYGQGGQGSAGVSGDRVVDITENQRRARMEQADNGRTGKPVITEDPKTKDTRCRFKADAATRLLVPSGVSRDMVRQALGKFFQGVLDSRSSGCYAEASRPPCVRKADPS